MNEFKHWQPVLLSHELKERPASVRVCGRDLVLFRGKSGTVGALVDKCPHRRMRLSKGRVEGDRLVCPYHLLAYDLQGQGQSAANPQLRPCAESFDVVERYGAIWLKERGVEAAFPNLDAPGFVCGKKALRHEVKAPLELVLDNFAEVEHAITVHKWLAYDIKDLPEVKLDIAMDEDTLAVTSTGPQRPVPLHMRMFFKSIGVQPRDTFEDTWTISFSPVWILYQHRWMDPRTQQERPTRARFAVFFTPIDENQTQVFTIVFMNAQVAWLQPLLEPLSRLVSHKEVLRDKVILENLGDRDVSLRGMKLGRHDKVLGEIRRRLDTIYRAGKRETPVQEHLAQEKVEATANTRSRIGA